MYTGSGPSTLEVKPLLPALVFVTSQDFIKFWGKFFAFVLLVLIEFFTGI
jgi:hypothetical protein